MIYVEMSGRLGNQLFRYSFARLLQELYYPEETICLNFDRVDKVNKTDKSFYRAILDFNLRDNITVTSCKNTLLSKTSLLQKIKILPFYLKIKKIGERDIKKNIELTKKYSDRLSFTGVYWFRYGYFNPLISKSKNKIVLGNFESPRYLSLIRNQLLKEITPKYPARLENIKLLNIIKETNSICISIRRGDFIENNDVASFHNVCDKNYYIKAIRYMKENIENPTFIFFSDDIERAKKNFKDVNYFFERGDDPVWEKIRLMKLCKHFIISNSTFSWWSMFLSDNESKIVVSPKKWFNGIEQYDLLLDSFVKI